jgi:hypothetical protein
LNQSEGTEIMQQVIRLPNGKRCSLKTYCASWRALKELPAGSQVRGFDYFPIDEADILREMRAAVHDRINLRGNVYGTSRKWSADWQRQMRHAASQINHARLIIDWLPADLLARFSYRLRCNRT